MATIGELLNRLETQVHDLRWTPQDTVGAHEAGWVPLARAAGQAITSLPLGGRSDQVKAGIRNVLAPLAHGPLTANDDAVPAPQLVELATTVGAISDSLAGILRFGPRPEQVGTPALELEADLLSAVHVAARWSRTTIEVQCPTPPRPALTTFLRDLIVVTEPYALIPPEHRASTFEDLAFVAPSSPGLEGAVAAWAETAIGILHDRYRVSGWAMQVIAADLALVSQVARSPFAVTGAAGSMEHAAPSHAQRALELAVQSWRRAAAWPPHLRLGGQNADLRLACRDLREGVASDVVSTMAQSRRLLTLAAPVGAACARAMSSLVRRHELWIHAPFLVPKVPFDRSWIREPSWSREGDPLLRAAETGNESLQKALSALGGAAARDDGRSGRRRWSPVAEPVRRPSRDVTSVAGAPLELGGSLAL